jgi:UbiD family decarboxylase
MIRPSRRGAAGRTASCRRRRRSSVAQAPTLTDLRAYIELLRAENEVVAIDAEVDPRLEAVEIHRRVIAAGGPALLFRRMKGSAFPAVTNLFGTARRIELAFGSRPRGLIERLARLPETLFPPTPARLWGQRDLLPPLLRAGLRRVNGGAVLAHAERPPRLGRLPVLTTWKKDGGPFLSLGLVYTEHPDGRGHNLGLYRMQVYNDATTGMHWQIGKGGGFHHAAAEARNESLPVVVFLGGPPALILSAIAPLPENVPEMLLASLLLGRRLQITTTERSPLPLAAGAEFALVGRVPAGERRAEGPFGDHYGYYSLTHQYPVFHVEALYHRQEPVYPATVVGKPRQEDFFLGDYLQELLSPLFPVAMPAVRDLWSYGETGYHALSAAVVHQRYKREAMGAAFRILGEGQLSLTKFLLVLDRACDLRIGASSEPFGYSTADKACQPGGKARGPSRPYGRGNKRRQPASAGRGRGLTCTGPGWSVRRPSGRRIPQRVGGGAGRWEGPWCADRGGPGSPASPPEDGSRPGSGGGRHSENTRGHRSRRRVGAARPIGSVGRAGCRSPPGSTEVPRALSAGRRVPWLPFSYHSSPRDGALGLLLPATSLPAGSRRQSAG